MSLLFTCSCYVLGIINKIRDTSAAQSFVVNRNNVVFISFIALWNLTVCNHSFGCSECLTKLKADLIFLLNSHSAAQRAACPPVLSPLPLSWLITPISSGLHLLLLTSTRLGK